MKRLMTILGLILFASFFQTSWGNNSSNTTSGNSSSSASSSDSTSTEKVEGSLNEINVNNPNSIIGNTIKIGNLEIAQYGFTNEMTWYVAMKACNDLGSGWRLPTQKELAILYVNRRKIGGFVYDKHWSSSEGNDNNAWAEDFNDNGSCRFISKSNDCFTRAVRGSGGNCSAPISGISSNPIIGNTIKIGNLEIAQKNFPYKMNWEDAKNACVGLRDRWRLPSRYELDLLHHYQSNTSIGGFEYGGYWSSIEESGGAWYGKIGGGGTYYYGSKDYLLDVRAVRDYIVSSQTIIGNTIKIGNLEIAQIDFPASMILEYAKKACAGLGDGWRLPTIEELDILYTNNDLIGGFATNRGNTIFYLSSTQPSGNNDVYVLRKDFSNGEIQHGSRFSDDCLVRAVRGSGGNRLDTISGNSSSEIIGNRITIGIIEIAEHDFPEKMNWDAAKKACNDLGSGWYLPTIYDLDFLYINKEKLRVIASNYYWSSTEENGRAMVKAIESGNMQDGNTDDNADKYYVRAVRRLPK